MPSGPPTGICRTAARPDVSRRSPASAEISVGQPEAGLPLAFDLAPIHDLVVNNARLVRLVLLLTMAVAGSSACSESAHRSTPSVPPPANSKPNMVAGSFHQPSGPGDAAAEYVTGMDARRDDLSDPLTCTYADYGALPLVFSRPGERLTVKPSRVVSVGRSRWRVSLALVSSITGPAPYVTATVIKTRSRYMVCRVH